MTEFKTTMVRTTRWSDEECKRRLSRVYALLLDLAREQEAPIVGETKCQIGEDTMEEKVEYQTEAAVEHNSTEDAESGWDLQGIRKSSSVEYFPYAMGTVTFILISPEYKTIRYAKTRATKRDMVLGALKGEILLAAWPGRWSQDIFEVDRKDALDTLLRK